MCSSVGDRRNNMAQLPQKQYQPTISENLTKNIHASYVSLSTPWPPLVSPVVSVSRR